MYTYLTEQLNTLFEPVTVLRDDPSEGKSLTRVRHKTTHRDFVLRQFRGDAQCYQKLLSVKSPYLPEVFEAAADGDRVMVLEEYIEGDLVSDMLKDTLFSEKETVSIVLDICQALQILHQRDIIHRDVKPENIILRGSKAVLIDLDAARIHRSETDTDEPMPDFGDTHILGTTGFASPEQYGLFQADGRSDIFSLGVTMNYLLTGKHPSQETYKGRLGWIIGRATNLQPAKRFQTVQELMEVITL